VKKHHITRILLFSIYFTLYILHLSASEPYDTEEYYDTGLYQSASVLVMCAETGEIVYETEGFALRYPASITKVMTALLVMEHVENLEEQVVLSAHAIDIPYCASRLWMHEGEAITVLEALYGIMLPSGNEVARALAEHVSESVPAFVERMNQRARELGANNTNFVNPCGLPGDGQYVTAYDVALIMRAATQHPIFIEIISTEYFELPPTNRYGNPRLLRNTNRLIRPDESVYNPYVIGGKTGFTNAAQHTLVSYVRKGSQGLIISVLYAPRGATFIDTTTLMDYAFEILAEAELERQATKHEALLAAELARLELEKYEYAYEPEPPLSQEYEQYDDVTDRNTFLIAAVSLITVILGLLAVRMYLRRRNRRRRGYRYY